jgi:hypothetical protein
MKKKKAFHGEAIHGSMAPGVFPDY